MSCFDGGGLWHGVVPLETPADYSFWNDLVEQKLPAEGGPIRLWRQVALAGPAVRLSLSLRLLTVASAVSLAFVVCVAQPGSFLTGLGQRLRKQLPP